MSSIKVLKKNDTGDSLIIDLSYVDDTEGLLDIPINTPCVFTMKAEGFTTPKINRANASILSSTGGTVRVQYNWGTDDLDTPDRYRGEFEFTISGKPVTAPTRGFVTVLVQEDLS